MIISVPSTLIRPGHVIGYDDDVVGGAGVFLFAAVDVGLLHRGDGTVFQVGAFAFQVPEDAFVVIGMVGAIEVQE